MFYPWSLAVPYPVACSSYFFIQPPPPIARPSKNGVAKAKRLKTKRRSKKK